MGCIWILKIYIYGGYVNFMKSYYGLGIFLLMCLILITNAYAIEITSIKCPDFRSGNDGYLIINAKSSYDGAFSVNINCQNIEQAYTVMPVSIGQEITEIKIPITGSVGSDTCQVTLKNSNGGDDSTTDSVNCNVLKPAMCAEGDMVNENNCIKKCVNGEKKELKCCDQGYEIKYTDANRGNELGGYDCQKIAGYVVVPENQSNQNSNSSMLSVLIIGVCIIVGFIILAIILSRNKKHNKK